MRTLPYLSPKNEAVHALSVLPSTEDSSALHNMLPSTKWKLHEVATPAEAIDRLRRRNRIAVVLCEADFGPCGWKLVLEEVQRLNDPPLIILTSRLADERLWAEALNLGVYDVLAKPFDANEVNRTLSSAWRWRNLHRKANAASKRLQIGDALFGHVTQQNKTTDQCLSAEAR